MFIMQIFLNVYLLNEGIKTNLPVFSLRFKRLVTSEREQINFAKLCLLFLRFVWFRNSTKKRRTG